MDNHSHHQSSVAERLQLEVLARGLRTDEAGARAYLAQFRSMPICDYCWSLLNGDGQAPYRMRPADPHRCCHCGHPATGLFTDVKPSEVRYPSDEADLR